MTVYGKLCGQHIYKTHQPVRDETSGSDAFNKEPASVAYSSDDQLLVRQCNHATQSLDSAQVELPKRNMDAHEFLLGAGLIDVETESIYAQGLSSCVV